MDTETEVPATGWARVEHRQRERARVARELRTVTRIGWGLIAWCVVWLLAGALVWHAGWDVGLLVALGVTLVVTFTARSCCRACATLPDATWDAAYARWKRWKR